MEVVIEIIKIILPGVAGGGIVHFFNFRAKIRRGKTEIQEADFDTVSKVVKSATADLKSLAERIGELETDRVRILEEVGSLKEVRNKLQEEIATLKAENKKLEETLRKYITRNNPTIKK
jgi:peptidoglycan hydrolase CwlO-like protein